MEGNFVSGEMDEKKEQEQLQEEEDRTTESRDYSSEDEGSGDYTFEDEGTQDYGPGGYHPVQIGDSLKSCRYNVRSLLGRGCFSTVWRAWDTHKSGHLKHMMQLLGEMPHKMALRLASKGFHDVCNNFIRITLDGETLAFSNENDGRRLHFQRLNEVLMEEHEFNELDANGMADFLGRILVFDPERRLTAAECLQHPWITQR